MAAEGVTGKEARKIQKKQVKGQAAVPGYADAPTGNLGGGPDIQTTQSTLGQANDAEPYDTFPGDNMPKKKQPAKVEGDWQNRVPGYGGTGWYQNAGLQYGGPGSVSPDHLTPAGNPRDEIIRRAAQQGVPKNFALAYSLVATRLDQTARTKKGAAGLFLVPDGEAVLNDTTKWRQNILAGMLYLKRLKHTHGSWDAAALAALGPKGAAAVRKAQHAIEAGRVEVPKGDPGIITLARPFDATPQYLSDFGRRKAGPGAGDYHTGIDIAAPDRTPLRALTGGQVVFAGGAGAAGQTVVVRDRSRRLWYYSHLAYTQVAQGKRVKPGDQLGAIGMTGQATAPHLHLGVKVKGQWGNPLALAQRAFNVPGGETMNDVVASYDFDPPSAGGATVSSVQRSTAPSPITGQRSVTQEWQNIVNSGPTSPETKTLAQRAGAVIPNG